MNDNEKFNLLNEIYKPLYELVKSMCSILKQTGYSYEWGYYGFHSVKKDDNFITEYFPIPVITVSNICDIGIDIDRIFIESKMRRESALEYDFTCLKNYNFEVYGVKEYENDFYNKNMELGLINQKIKNSTESQIAVSIYLEKDVDMQEILNIITIFNNH